MTNPRPWTAQVITLFPDMFPGVLGHSLTGRALDKNKWALDVIGLRQFGVGKHQDVDDTPTGGGAGMVLRPDVVGQAIDMAKANADGDMSEWPIIYLSPRGPRFDQPMAQSFSKMRGITLICGRFEGIDQRVLDKNNVEEVSIGDFILTGGEIAAQALIDATVRLIPSVLGNSCSIEDESFSNGLLEYPQYTRPTDWDGHKVPEILLSGHHGQIAKWRKSQSERLTQERRPDLWRAHLEENSDGDPVEGQEL